MNTSIPNISKPYLLDDFIASTNLVVRLFVNHVKGNEETINFVEPVFSGYYSKNIDNSKWSVSILHKDYATCTHTIPIVFNNLDEIYESESIIGYYVTNEAGDNLWYETFKTEKILNVEEGMAINLIVNLNKPDSGRTFVVIVLDTSDPTVYLIPNDATIQISNESWGDVSVSGSLTDAMNRDFGSFKTIFNLVLSADIFPSEETPFTFTAFFQSYGFNDLTTNITASKKDVNTIYINLTPVDNPPPAPTQIPEPDYINGDTITLHGPYDSKSGLILSSVTEDVFSFSFKNDVGLTPKNMLLFINDLRVASVDYVSGYEGEVFDYTYGSYNFTGVFTDPEVRFTVDAPGPTRPPVGASAGPYSNGDLVILNGPTDSSGALSMRSIGSEKLNFNYLEDGGLAALTMAIYLDGILVANVEYFSKYSDQPLTFISNEGLVFNSHFNSPLVNLDSRYGVS